MYLVLLDFALRDLIHWLGDEVLGPSYINYLSSANDFTHPLDYEKGTDSRLTRVMEIWPDTSFSCDIELCTSSDVYLHALTTAAYEVPV